MTPDAVQLEHGDSRDVLKTLADNSVDACVTDPPYALVSIVRRFGKPNAAPCKEGADGRYKRASAGFMGKTWDTGETAFDPEFWGEVWRVLKPGGHVLACGGTRSYHRLACAIEDAGRFDEKGEWAHLGFEIRDQIGWCYGSGFPKSHDVSKGIDRHNGDKRPVIGRERISNDIRGGALLDVAHGTLRPGFERDITSAASAASAAWEGWGTALKPAWEPIVLARKPIDGTVAANVLKHGTGALNIEACRIHTEEGLHGGAYAGENRDRDEQRCLAGGSLRRGIGEFSQPVGRWPANLITDGSDEVIAAFPGAPGQQQNIDPSAPSPKTSRVYGKMNREGEASANRRYADRGATDFSPLPGQRRGDAGSAARFFYTAKADADDRFGSKHPTVKPIDLMAYLCRLITPPGGLVLDPFAGSGTTGIACLREGFRCILIEREAEYVADINARLASHAGEGGHSAAVKGRRTDQRKARGEDTPLFGGGAA